MKIILVPDEGEWVLVPKINNALPGQGSAWLCVNDEFCTHRGPCSTCEECKEAFDAAHSSIIAAAPPCKVVELPRRKPMNRNLSDYGQGYIDGHDACLDEIERRAK